MNENTNNVYPLSTSVVGNKNANRNMEMRKTTMQTSHKKNLENVLEDFGFGQNFNQIEEENLAITSNDKRLFSSIFERIISISVLNQLLKVVSHVLLNALCLISINMNTVLSNLNSRANSIRHFTP